jgi:hypothetical protein
VTEEGDEFRLGTTPVHVGKIDEIVAGTNQAEQAPCPVEPVDQFDVDIFFSDSLEAEVYRLIAGWLINRDERPLPNHMWRHGYMVQANTVRNQPHHRPPRPRGKTEISLDRHMPRQLRARVEPQVGSLQYAASEPAVALLCDDFALFGRPIGKAYCQIVSDNFPVAAVESP